MSFTKVDILEPLYERLIQGPDNVNGIKQRGLIYGLSYGYGGLTNPIAITIINYENEDSFKVAAETLPFGVSLLGIVEYESADDDQEVYSTLDILDYPILFKVADGQLLASTGLDFRTMIDLNVMSPSGFWEKSICTFRIRGKFLISSLLEIPDLKDCFALAKARIINQAAFVIGKNQSATILPRNGHLVSDLSYLKKKPTVTEIVKAVKTDLDDLKLKNSSYYRPDISLVDVYVLNDLTKCNSFKKSPVLISDKTARCKTFEHYLEIDCLCIVPMTMPAQYLYRKFNAAICSQFENGFHDNIRQQLGNSISANKPIAYHFWPRFCQHFITIIFPQNIPEEKLVSKREALHRLYFISETKPVFRRTSSILNNPTPYLISPHTSLSGKYSETQIISGHYEYRHYMQDDFNDEGWGCAYRSLQTIISWFRLQGYTQTSVPTHREIQECLVSLGDKKSTFVGSRQWIGSTEVGYVLEALLGISCRILALSSGGELASRASDLESHFRNYGTPVMIGGGVLAHTIIGVSRNPDSDDDVQFLVVDPHYNGKEDLKTILNKGWIGWKDTKFWSKIDFYNLCLPLLPSTI